MEANLTYEIEFENAVNEDDMYQEVEFTVEYHIENDGIGSYEFWGSVGYDAGNNYVEIDDITYDREAYTPKEQEVIDKFIVDYNGWEEDIPCDDYEDYDDYRDYDED